MRRRCHLVATGKVQGTGLRDASRRRAGQQNLGGWVMNMPDGTVQLEVEGEAAEVALFVAWLRASPASSRVAGVEVDDVPPLGEEGMVIRRS